MTTAPGRSRAGRLTRTLPPTRRRGRAQPPRWHEATQRERRRARLCDADDMALRRRTPAWGHPWVMSLLDFAMHIGVGTAIFLLIALVAVGLDLLLNTFAHYGISTVILTGLLVAKLFLFLADILVFLIFVV